MNPKDIKEITDKRLYGWTRRLVAEHSTPLILLGVGHDGKSGQLTVLTVEEVPNDVLIGALKFALRQLGSLQV